MQREFVARGIRCTIQDWTVVRGYSLKRSIQVLHMLLIGYQIAFLYTIQDISIE